MATILVTGGCGYIGSHTVLELLNKDYDVVVVDNFSNSSFESLRRVQKITGKAVTFYEADIRDVAAMENIFAKHSFDAVIHFAAFKAVGESVRLPLKYYENNISGTVSLLQIMEKYNVKKIIFSSSATVYGNPERLPLDENCRLSTTNPYGSTKLMMEMIMQDLYKADKNWNIILLRYFNPVGAHESGLIGEDPKGIPLRRPERDSQQPDAVRGAGSDGETRLHQRLWQRLRHPRRHGGTRFYPRGRFGAGAYRGDRAMQRRRRTYL